MSTRNDEPLVSLAELGAPIVRLGFAHVASDLLCSLAAGLPCVLAMGLLFFLAAGLLFLTGFGSGTAGSRRSRIIRESSASIRT